MNHSNGICPTRYTLPSECLYIDRSIALLMKTQLQYLKTHISDACIMQFNLATAVNSSRPMECLYRPMVVFTNKAID